MAINKIVFDGDTLIDLTADTVTANSLLEGYTAHDKTGALIVGTATGGSGDGYVWQDAQGYVHLSDEEGTQTTIDALTVNASGTYTAPTGHAYSPVTVPSGSATTPTTSISVTPSISVNSSGLITASASGSKSVTPTVSAGWVSSGTAGTVSVSGSNTSQLSIQAATTITPTTSEQTAVAAGKYTTGAVKVAAMPSGTAGTPTASKGTVSNHSISVTPSVTNSTGYITGGTKTGTAVTVSASELVSGTKSISANGTDLDVTNYAFVDVAVPSSTPTLITKSITANGTYNASSDNADGYSSVTVNVSGGGGGGEPAPKKQINFIDYDGTILHSYTKSEWQSVSALPSNPSHTGLTAQGWNWTKAQIDAQLTAMPDGDVWVGQMYITDDGKTRIYIHLEEGRLHPYLGICPNGTVVVDWGDSSATNTLTGTSLSTVKVADHTYASSGDYMITLTVSSGSFAFYGVSNTAYLLRKANSTTGIIHRVYSNAVQKVEIGASASIGTYAFYNCYSLASITIPSSVTSIGSYAFYTCYSLASITIPSGVANIGTYVFSSCYSLASVTIPSSVTIIGTYAFQSCYSLASVTIPSGVTSIGNNALYNCYSLASITIPSGVTSIGTYVFGSCYSLASVTIPSEVTSIGNNALYNCYSLASVTIPSEVTSIGTYVFSGCYSLASITIPSEVTSIGTYAFQSCHGVAEYHIKPTTPPTLANTNAFQNIQSDCVIYVPSASLEDYQTATNWSTYASYMQGE